MIRERLQRRRRDGDDAGSASAEFVILVPVLIVLLLLIVALGRVAYSKQRVETAAAAGARAASLNPAGGQSSARDAVSASLESAGLSCADLTVDVGGDWRAGGVVTVTVTCVADLSDAVMAGVPGSMTVTYTSSSPLEKYRQIGGDVS